jgi:hypothetical protein
LLKNILADIKGVVKYAMEQTRLFVYFPKSISGYEVIGDAILPYYETFMEKPDTYLIEYSYSEYQNGMHLFVYEWDKSQKKRKSVFESFRKEIILVSAYKYLESLPQSAKDMIYKEYLKEELDLEAEANAV